MPSVAAWRAVAALLAAQPDPATELELRRQLCREASRAAWADGYRQGYERGARLLETTWPQIAAVVTRGEPSFVEMELRRWGPGGRERFGETRPGDRFPLLEAAS